MRIATAAARLALLMLAADVADGVLGVDDGGGGGAVLGVVGSTRGGGVAAGMWAVLFGKRAVRRVERVAAMWIGWKGCRRVEVRSLSREGGSVSDLFDY